MFGLKKQFSLVKASMAVGKAKVRQYKEHNSDSKSISGNGERGECGCGGSSDVTLLSVGLDYFKRYRKK